ncbi:unnamed protein product [Caenorhabditis angaria]|uniref:Non-specific serine/threonine protein kinase n=1 Tax=Caenorhabditis angaria TaxID=860376 RepID=A0A9P1MU88_9PELO|nr:unnamed protein product [Caenorhabditis angaria]
MVQSRILIEYRNDSEEAMRILEKSIKTSETRDSCAENQNSSEVKLKVLLRFHDVCMDQLTELDKYKEGLIYRIKKQAIEQFQTQIDQKSEITRRKSSATRQIADDEENRRTIHRLTREQKCEQDHVDQTEAAIVAAAQKAVASGLAALETIATASRDAEDDATQRSQAALVIFPLIDVIFKYEVLPEIVAVVRDRTPRISSRLWICAASHVASRCFAARQQSPLRKYLRQILTRLVIDYPFHVLHTLLMYEYESNGAETRRFIDQIADECGSGGGDARKLRDIIREMRRAHEAYREFARIDARKDLAPAVNSRYTLPASLKLHHVELTRLPLPCVTQKLPRSACDYSARELVTWQTWKPYFTLADGLSTPKIWEIQGSDGFWYKIVWKKEDVRQDLLVEQMFDITNCILDKNDGLKNLRTYKIVPLDQGCGLIEFCHGTVSMKELLCGANRQGGLHHKYHPNECSISEITRQMRDCQKDSIEQRRQVFINICRQISPVFRHHFYESNHFSCQIWRQKLTEYRRSLSTWSVVGYIVGLGDRHTSNILFDMQQCHFVHIDFGMILEYSKRLLPVPELVPFRLTRDLLDPILIEGIENGQLAENCTNVLEKLKTHQKVLLGVASGLLRETMSNFREVEENLNRPSFISQMAIGRLREKLARKQQISNLEIRRLLRESTNSDNLSRMFCGWMPFL